MNYEYSKDEVQIIKAAWASEHGKQALMLIVERLCGIHADAFHPDPYIHARGAGRRSVGVDLMRAINAPLDKLVKAPDEPRSNRPITATERAERTERAATLDAIKRVTGASGG